MRKLKVLLVTVLFVFAISAVSYAADETAPTAPPDRSSLTDSPSPTNKAGVKHKTKSKKKKASKHNAATAPGAAKY
jgi:hypothetical protein